jgi:hypothetical protein
MYGRNTPIYRSPSSSLTSGHRAVWRISITRYPSIKSWNWQRGNVTHVAEERNTGNILVTAEDTLSAKKTSGKAGMLVLATERVS